MVNPRSGRILVWFALLGALILLSPSRAAAQDGDTLKVVLPASQQGIRFLPPRPGGRRVIIVPVAPGSVAPAQTGVPLAAAPVRNADTARLESMLTSLERRIQDLQRSTSQGEARAARERTALRDSLEAMRRQMTVYRDSMAHHAGMMGSLHAAPTAHAPAAADSVARIAPPPPPIPTPAPPPAGMPPAPDPDVIERMMLDTGLFRAVQVVFELNSDRLLAFALPTLDAIAEVMGRNPDLSLQVVGHTDNTGSAEYNAALSQKRAESVVAYLTGRGIGADRLTALGRGEDEPIADNAIATGRVLNRRVEFVVR